MTSAAATSSSQHAHSSRFSRFGTFGFRQSRPGQSSTLQPEFYNDANDDDWVIPYNGPVEPPRTTLVGGVQDRDSWAGLVITDNEHDGFERNRNGRELGHGVASTSGHGHSHHGHSSSQDFGKERISRDDGRVLSPISKYSGSGASTFGAEDAGGARRTNALGSPTTSPASPHRGLVPSFLDTGGVGMSPVPTQRVGHTANLGHGHDGDRAQPLPVGGTASPTHSPRESLASFWTFGRSGGKKSPPPQVQQRLVAARPSTESHFSRRSISSRQTGATDGLGMRERSATVTEQPALTSRPHRPRAFTAALAIPSTSPVSHPQNVVPAVIEPDTASSNGSYQRHPYAFASPPTGHRQNSQLMKLSSTTFNTSQQQPPIPQPQSPHYHYQKRSAHSPSRGIPFLSPSKSINSLKRSAKNLKASISTPDLRTPPSSRKHVANGASSADTPGTPSATSMGTKWLSAETWCDALLFPRPRFRMRAAHVISPPGSPTEYGPPYSAPLLAERTRKRSLLRTDAQGKDGALSASTDVPSRAAVPSYAVHPPEQPQAGPSKKIERPLRPKAFAQDDLAIPSPIPSLATVLKQNEAFDKEREEWKSKAAKSFGNKRSRSLSKSRARNRMRHVQDDRESELATSFGMIAASAVTGNQTLKPTIHFASTPAVSRSGFGTTTGTSSAFTGLNTTSSHSRNASGASHTGGGHARKESWSKTALNAAKSATGLCNFHQDVSPADEKTMVFGPSSEKDQSRYLTVHPQIREPQPDLGDDIIVISPQKAGPSELHRVPSHQSYASTSLEGVGIALSTPTALVDSTFQMQMTGHPFASGTTHGESIPRASDYAGPHPSKRAEHSSNEMSAGDAKFSHRLPVPTERPSSTSLHPYSAYNQKPRRPIRIPTYSISPAAKMFAEISPDGIREVYPDEIQYSPYSSRHPGSSSRNSEALGVEEALNVAFSSRSDSQTTEDENLDAPIVDDVDKQFNTEPKVQELPMVHTGAYRGRLMPQIDELRESWHASLDEESADFLRVKNDSSTTPNSTFRARASPGMMSIDSSPMTSPRHFKQFDDMEDYSDIFYRAPDPGALMRPSPSRNLSGSTADSEPIEKLERPLLARSNSALTNLKRQLSQKYVQNMQAERHILSEDTGLSRRSEDAGPIEEGNIDDAYAIASQASSPPGAAVPLRATMSRPESSGSAVLIPEDVESSRASSILDQYVGEDGVDVIYRVKEVPSQSTPPISKPELVSESRHGSYIATSFNPTLIDPQGPSRPPASPPVNILDMHIRPGHSSHSGSLKPPLSGVSGNSGFSRGSLARASYLTSTSSSSRISESQLTGFPSPPNQGQNALTPGSIIQSYFGMNEGDASRGSDGDAMSERENRSRPHRITFPVREDEELAINEEEQRRADRQSRRTTFGTLQYDST